MAPPLILRLTCLFASVHAVIIEPNFQALTWKHNGTDFWAPTHLKSSNYHFKSYTGDTASSLSRRRVDEPNRYIGCTALTIPASADSLSAAVLDDILSSFAVDDVWSEEQFLGCLVIQSAEGVSKLQVDASFNKFLKTHDIEETYVSPAFNFKRASSRAGIQTLKTPRRIPNGPYVASTSSRNKGELSMTPVYALHADSYEGK